MNNVPMYIYYIYFYMVDKIVSGTLILITYLKEKCIQMIFTMFIPK